MNKNSHMEKSEKVCYELNDEIKTEKKSTNCFRETAQ